MDRAGLRARVGPILVFVVCLAVVAELSTSVGVVATVARAVVRLAAAS